MLPEKTLEWKGTPCHGGKHSKERMTVLVGANADGTEKLSFLVIGKSKQPLCFKNVRFLPTVYDFSSKAWMTSGIFESWLCKLDNKFQRQKRSILLTVDNCPAHPIVSRFRNVKLAFLPPNATSKLQPMDQEIIRALKLLAKLIASVNSHNEFKVSLLDALHFINRAWNDMPSTIVKIASQNLDFLLLSLTLVKMTQTQGSYNVHSYSGDFERLMVGM